MLALHQLIKKRSLDEEGQACCKILIGKKNSRASCDYWLLMFIGNKAFGCVAKA